MTLSAKFALRGWKSLPYALVDITTGESYFITSKTFNAIIDATSQDTAYLQESEVVSCLIRENILIEEDRELFDYQKALAGMMVDHSVVEHKYSSLNDEGKLTKELLFDIFQFLLLPLQSVFVSMLL